MIWPGRKPRSSRRTKRAIPKPPDAMVVCSLRQLAAVQKITELLGDHRRVHGVGVAEAGLVVVEVLILEALARRRDFGDPRIMRHRRHRIGQRFQRRQLAADDAELDRQVPADVFMRLIDADVLCVGTERELADGRHAVLADQDDQVGAGERARRGVGRQRTGIRKLALHRAGLDDRDLRLLREALQRIPRLGVEHAVARYDHRTPRGLDQLNRLGDVFRRWMRPRVGAVVGLVVEELELAGVLEARGCDFGREVEMHRPGHPALELPERVAGVLVHAARDDQPLAVLLQPFRRWLLIAKLDARLGVFHRNRHVAGDDQQRCAGGVCAGDRANHVGEARALGAGRDGDFSADADKRVSGMGHRSFVAPPIRGDAGGGERVDHRIVTGTREQRRDAFLLAGAREHLRAGHWEFERDGRGSGGGSEFSRHTDWRHRRRSRSRQVLAALLLRGKARRTTARPQWRAAATALRRNVRRL